MEEIMPRFGLGILPNRLVHTLQLQGNEYRILYTHHKIEMLFYKKYKSTSI